MGVGIVFHDFVVSNVFDFVVMMNVNATFVSTFVAVKPVHPCWLGYKGMTNDPVIGIRISHEPRIPINQSVFHEMSYFPGIRYVSLSECMMSQTSHQ